MTSWNQSHSVVWEWVPTKKNSKVREHLSTRIFLVWDIPRYSLEMFSKLLTGYLTGHCHLEKHMVRIGAKQNMNCRFCWAEVRKTAAICRNYNHLGKDVIDEREVPSMKPLEHCSLLKLLASFSSNEKLCKSHWW